MKPPKGVLTQKPVGCVSRELSAKMKELGLASPMLDYTRMDAHLPEGQAGTVVCIYGLAHNGQEVGAYVQIMFEEDLQVEDFQNMVLSKIKEDLVFKGFIEAHQK
jgi:hypothetical protein